MKVIEINKLETFMNFCLGDSIHKEGLKDLIKIHAEEVESEKNCESCKHLYKINTIIVCHNNKLDQETTESRFIAPEKDFYCKYWEAKG